MKNLLILATLLLSASAFGQNCDRILQEGVFNKYNLKSSKSLKSALKKSTEMSFEQIKSLAANGTTGGDVSVLWGLVSLSGDADSQKKSYEKISQNYRDNFDFNIDTSEELEIVNVIADKYIIDAWKGCVISPKAISHTTLNDCMNCDNCDNTFLINVAFKKFSKGSKNIKITNITVTNATFDDNIVIKKGAKIKEFSSLTQKFVKSSKNTPITIIIDYKGYESAKINIPGCTPPPPPVVVKVEVPKPTTYIFEIKTNWEIVDDDNNDAITHRTDEHCYSDYTQNIVLKVGDAPVRINFSQCCDDEVRVDAYYFLKISDSRELELYPGNISIFEGNSCGHAVHEKTEQISDYRKLPISDVEVLAKRIDDDQFDWGRVVIRSKLLSAQ